MRSRRRRWPLHGAGRRSLGSRSRLDEYAHPQPRAGVRQPGRHVARGEQAPVHRLLGAAGLAIPAYEVFLLTRLEPACEFLRAHPRGCVVKPVKGYGGQGVTTHVQSPDELKRAALLASLYGYELMIEEQIPGESYRLLVLEGKVIHAVCRRGPRVRGDGQSIHSSAHRGGQRGTAWSRAAPSSISIVTASSRWDISSCRPSPSLPAGRECRREERERSRSQTRRGPHRVHRNGDRSRVRIHPARRRDRPLASVGSDFLGVDVITTDPTVPLAAAGGVINEVNTTPALHHHYDATREPFPAVAIPTLNAILRRKAAVAVRAH